MCNDRAGVERARRAPLDRLVAGDHSERRDIHFSILRAPARGSLSRALRDVMFDGWRSARAGGDRRETFATPLRMDNDAFRRLSQPTVSSENPAARLRAAEQRRD